MAERRYAMTSLQRGPEDGDGVKPSGPVLVLPPNRKPPKWWVWKDRIFLVVFVLFCLEVGIVLTVLPWTAIWTNNSLLMGYPQLRQWVTSNFIRGLISGMGLIDIWMGIAEAVRYRESVD